MANADKIWMRDRDSRCRMNCRTWLPLSILIPMMCIAAVRLYERARDKPSELVVRGAVGKLRVAGRSRVDLEVNGSPRKGRDGG